MQKKGNSSKHPRRVGSNVRNRIIALVIVLIGIAAVFYLLEKVKNSTVKDQPTADVRVEPQPVSPHAPPSGYRHDVYSSVQIPPAGKPPKVSKPVKHGSIAIIIDDMGANTKDAERLLAIGMPVTFAIIPGLAHSRRVAELAHEKGRGVMIHLPMEPQGYPQQRLEKNGLLLSQSNEEISGRVNAYLKEIPYADGANNHMGSSFTEHEDKMLPVLDVLKRNGMFFVDSKTSSRSVGYPLAVRLGMQAGARNIFLDNEQTVDKIKTQLRAAASMANKRGRVIAICHPHPETIQALQELLPELKREGITFVTAAHLVR